MLPYYISLWLVPMKEDATYRIPIIIIDTGQTIFTRVIDLVVPVDLFDLVCTDFFLIWYVQKKKIQHVSVDIIAYRKVAG